MKKPDKLVLDKFLLWQVMATVIVLAIIFLLVINSSSVQYLENNFQSVWKKDTQIYFLDVGQASSTLIITPDDKSILFDTGSTQSADDLTSSLKFLLDKNKIEGIDLLILSHSDADHVGGTMAVMQNFDVKSVLRPKQLAMQEERIEGYQVVTTYTYSSAIDAVLQEGCPVSFVEDDKMAFGELNIEIFAADKDYYSETNSYSPFILGRTKSRSFLLTADATQEREEEFLSEIKSRNWNLSIDFLQVAHHGSKYSSSPNFLKAVAPKYAFISAADDAHPSGAVITRLKDVGIKQIFVTKQVGMIGVGINSGQFVICDMHRYFDLPLCVMILCLFLLASWQFFNSERIRIYGKKGK